MRKDPSHRSELVTQLVFGDIYEIIEERHSWALVLSRFDEYLGWIDKSLIFLLEESILNQFESDIVYYPLELISSINKTSENNNLLIPYGASIYENIVKLGFDFAQTKMFKKQECVREQIVSEALKFMDTPYLWGGKTPMGMDCSGFTQTLFKLMGIKLKRDASQQAAQGTAIGFINEARNGDLAFFGDKDSISHVGILIDAEHIIHASGKVRIDKIDHEGIFNQDFKKYTHKLRLLRNVID